MNYWTHHARAPGPPASTRAGLARILRVLPLKLPIHHAVPALLARATLGRVHARGKQLPVGPFRHQLRVEHVYDENGTWRALALVSHPYLVLPKE